MYRVDVEKRQVIVSVGVPRTEIVLNEFQELSKIFLEGTEEKYRCILILTDVELVSDDGEKTGEVETKAFAKKIGYDNWIMEFIPSEYDLEVQHE